MQPGHRAGRRHEGQDVLPPGRPPVQVAGQVHGRVPAPRHRQAVGLQPVLAADRADGDALEPLAALAAADLGAGDHPEVLRFRGVVAAVDQGRNMHSGGHQVARRAMRVVGVAEDRQGPARHHAPAVQIGAHRAGGHDPGPVVVAEGHRALDGAGGQHRLLRDDPPEGLERGAIAARAGMMAHPFERAIGAAVIGTGHRGARHQAHVLHRRQFGDDLLGPGRAGPARHLQPLGQKPPAEAAVLLGQDHVGPGPPGAQRRHQTGRAGPDHQQIAERPGPLIAVRVALLRERAETGSASDHRLVELFPEGGRPHEGLVIEPRAEERRSQIVHRHHVETQRRPAVLALRLQPVIELLHGRARVRLLRRAAPDGDQSVRLLAAGGQDAPRAVILEGPPDQPDVVGQQRRGQRVAPEPLVEGAVECEAQRRPAVDQPASRQPHAAPPRAASCASSVAAIAWVTVSRVTASQAPQPAS